MAAFFGLLWVTLVIGSLAGGLLLARKWVKNTAGRIFLALALVIVFAIASTVAVISGCSAIVWPPNFH